VIEVVVYGTPAPAGSKTVGFAKGGRHFVRDSSGKRGSDWRRNVAQAAGIAMQNRALLDGPLVLEVVFTIPRPKSHYGARGIRPSAPTHPTVAPDTTKLLRAIEDAMEGIVYRNDAQIITQTARKVYGEPASARILIDELAWPMEAVA
jgi:Holliday junction resolvase RusA-like endonuclease